MSTTTTQLILAQEIARNLDAIEQGTATGGAVGSLTCTSYPFFNSGGSTSAYVNSEIRMATTTDSLAPIGEARTITAYAPTTGVFSVSPEFTAAPAASDTFDVFKQGIRYADFANAINRCLRNLHYVTIVPITLVADGDMEDSGVTSWTATNATSSKVTSSGNVLYGSQSLRVLNSVALGYAQGATIKVRPSTQYLIQARVRVETGTGTLIAYDVTNSAAIDSSNSWAYQGWGTISYSFTTPATCEAIALRLQGTGTLDDCYWDNIILLRTGATEIPLPSWITNASQVRRVLMDSQKDYYDTDSFSEVAFNIRMDMDNPVQMFWLSLAGGVSYPTWIEASRSYAELSTYSSTTLCDKELIILGGTVELLSTLIGRFKGDSGIPHRQDYARFLPMFKARQREVAPPRIVQAKLRYGAYSPSPRFR